MKRLGLFLAGILAVSPVVAADNILVSQPNGQWAIVKSTDNGGVQTLEVDANIVSGGGTGGTASDFGDPFPTAGTAAGMSDGADMVPLTSTDGTSLDVNCVAGCSSASGIAPVVSSSVETGHVIKASAGDLYGLQVTSGAVAGYVMVFNSTTVPAAGAVTPVKCFVIGANSSLGVSFDPTPLALSTGIAVAFSTTGCFTKTDSATAFISAQAL